MKIHFYSSRKGLGIPSDYDCIYLLDFPLKLTRYAVPEYSYDLSLECWRLDDQSLTDFGNQNIWPITYLDYVKATKEIKTGTSYVTPKI